MGPKALDIIEESFQKYLMGETSISELENSLSVALGSLPFESEKSFKVTVKLGNRVSQQFFGIECFPSITALEKIAEKFIHNEEKYEENTFTAEEFAKLWRAIDHWQIMIDLLCVDRNFISFNPKELTAMLLHEVSYVLASDRPVLEFYERYRESLLHMRDMHDIDRTRMSALYEIPMAISCTPRLWLSDNNTLNLDISADVTLIDSGYAQHLATAVTKIVKAAGNQVFDPTNYNDVSTSINWVNKNMVDIVHRRNSLKDELYYIAIRRNDGYFPALCSRVLDIMGARLRERYTGAVAESYGTGAEALANGEITLEKYEPIFDLVKFGQFERNWNSAQESFLNRKTKKRVTLPSQYDIDRIAIEIDKIQNQYDRLYVLDLIYEQIQNLDMFEESLIGSPSEQKRWENRISQMRNQLDILRSAVLQKKNFDKTYKVFVKVPDEYAG